MGNLSRNAAKFIAVCISSFFILLSMNPAATFAAQDKLRKVTFLCINNRAPILDAGVFTALGKGFYREEGLDVSIEGGTNANDSVQLIGENKGFAGSADVYCTMQARLKGMPVISVGVVTQSISTCIVSLKDNPIIKPADLKGKTIAIHSPSVNETIYKAFMKRQHIDRKEVVELESQSTAPLLIAKKVDCCLSTVYHSPSLVEAAGLTPVILDFDDYGLDAYGVNIVVNEDSVKNHPDLVRAFMKATVRGWEYALQHEKEAASFILKYNPSADPQYLAKGLARILPKVAGKETQKYGLFYQTEDKWNQAQDILIDAGEMDKKLDVRKCFTNEFLSKK